jgi:hypothetical protein
MPSVPMNGGTFRKATSIPLTMPGIAATATATSAPNSTASPSPMSGVAQLITCAATTAASPMMNPIDRSIPPEMMTNVCPVASNSGATAKTAMDWMLNGLNRNVPPKAIRDQISNPRIRKARNSQARRSAIRCRGVLARSAWSACGATWESGG